MRSAGSTRGGCRSWTGRHPADAALGPETFSRSGIALVRGAEFTRSRVTVTDHVSPLEDTDLAIVAIRRDQLREVLPLVAGLRAENVLFLQNNPQGSAAFDGCD